MEKKNAILGRAALLATTFIWGSSFVILKRTLDSIPVLWVLAIRFGGAALLMAMIGFRELKKLDRHYLKYGVTLGVVLFASYVLQTYGLVYTTPAKNSFLTATCCVIVPFLWWIFFKIRPDRYNVAAALICILGMALVSFQGEMTVGIGDGLTMLCGFFYALQIIMTSRAVEERSVLLINVLQFTVVAVLCGIFAPFVSPFPRNAPVSAWLSIAYLCVMCTAVCFMLQGYGQKYTPPQSTAIILTLESVFGTAISLIFYDEQITLRIALGFIMIFVSVIISETKLSFIQRRERLAVKQAEQ
ncbi:MAG TPA: EamA family transporter [Clostridiales bacterium]|nr:EamA family transporter [Clostridiales bacterium]